MQIVKLAWREIRNARSFTFLFVANLSLGLLGFLCLNAFNSSLNKSLANRAKTLLASDLSLGGRRDLSDKELQIVQSILGEKLLKSHRLISIYSMGAVKSDKSSKLKSRLMNIKAIENNYPLYGNINLLNGGEINSQSPLDLQEQPFIWISEELEQQLKLSIGDSIKLGAINFKITDIIKEDTTTSWSGVGLAPKVYVGRKFLLQTGLISFGSVANYSYQYLLRSDYQGKDSLAEIKKSLLADINDPAIKIYLPDDSDQQAGRVLGYLSDYLGLVALVALFLSGIGTAYLFQSFLFLRLKEIGVLKSLGMTRQRVMGIYATQVVILGVLALLLATIMSWVLLPLLQKFVVTQVGMDMELYFPWDALVVGLVVALLTGLLLCLPILKKVLSLSTKEILFGEVSGEVSPRQSWSMWEIMRFTPLAIVFWSLSVWQAHSFIIGTVFVSAILLSMLVLLLMPLLIRLAAKHFDKNNQRLSSPGSLTTGLAYRSLIRNPFASTMSFLALSLGVMLLSLIGQLEKSLQTELVDNSVAKPSLFLFDIQEDQYQGLLDFCDKNNVPLIAPTPMVRGRISHINGSKYHRTEDSASLQTREDETRSRFRNRGINITYALGLKPSEELVEGTSFSGKFDSKKQEIPFISLEKRYAERMQVGIGDVITFDILGVEVKGKILNLRKVKWTSFVPNFFITFQPGVLEEAPKTFLAAIGNLDQVTQYQVQDQIVEKFHNISILNVKELISKILKTFGMMGIAIKVMALLCLIVGMVVIFAITQHQVRKQAVELTIQKVLGLSRFKQFIVINKTFLAIVFFSLCLGTSLSVILGNILSILFFDGVWSLDFEFVIALFVAIILLTITTVSLASAQVLAKKSRVFLS